MHSDVANQAPARQPTTFKAAFLGPARAPRQPACIQLCAPDWLIRCTAAGVVDYTYWQPGRPDAALFDTPALCKGVEPQGGDDGPSARRLRMASLLPRVAYLGDAEVSWLACTCCQNRRQRSAAAAFQLNTPLAHAISACPMPPPCPPPTPPCPHPRRSTTPSWPPTAPSARTRPWLSTTAGKRSSAPTWP